MGRKPGQFSELNTTHPRKIDTIKKQIAIANAAFPEGFSGYCVGLPGMGDQAPRHRTEYLDYGVPEERQVMVDYNAKVHASQVSVMKKEGYKGSIVLGALNDVVNGMWLRGKQVDIIDFDDVRCLMPEHINMIRVAAKHDVKMIIIVVTNRCPWLSDFHKMWKERLGLELRWVKKVKKFVEPLKDIQIGIVKAVALRHGYEVNIMPYKGIGPPMMSCVLTKK